MIGASENFQILGQGRQNGVTGAIRQASASTGVDFNYLVNQANVESGMNPSAHSRSSSATGLYQFIEQTWLRMVKSHGAEHGYGQFANAIHQDRNGHYHVSSRAMRNTILNLRKDPKASSLMAAELANENDAYLRRSTGADPTQTDLYLAHFLGAGGASNFLKSMKKNPWAPAASFFPEAAHANRGVFYAQGKPLSLQAIYNRFESKFSGGDPVETNVADAAPAAPVNLPEAIAWNNPRPNSVAQRITQNFAAPAPQENNGLGAIGGYLSSPVEVMEMAQTDVHVWRHNDSSRYNA
jgi:hypothetical protein